jgi:predicted alpha/beta superfamily hydrolase
MNFSKNILGLTVASLWGSAVLNCFARTNPPVVMLQLRVTGTVEHLAPLDSKFVNRRNVDVWLPPSYSTDAARAQRYPVVYVHDGQNVFDPATSFIGVDWGIDETMTRLIAEQKVPEAIVVAIWNTPKRLAEYMPQPAIERAKESELDEVFKTVRQNPLGDAYLKYIVTELKPAVDARYRTLPDRAHTSVLGSSLGGLISLAAICKYPEVFGAAACLSTSLTVAGGAAAQNL